MVPQYCILNALISSSLWQGVDCLGHAGPTVEQQLFSVDLFVVLIHQGLSLFQPIEAIAGIGAIKPWDLSKGFIYSASPVIFCLLFFVLFLLSFFFFLPFVSPSGYVPYLIFLVVSISFAKLIGLKNQYCEQMDC